jgi:hypothetical protein
MSDSHELNEEELARERAEALPDREAMSIVPLTGDPSEFTLPPMPDGATADTQPVEPRT